MIQTLVSAQPILLLLDHGAGDEVFGSLGDLVKLLNKSCLRQQKLNFGNNNSSCKWRVAGRGGLMTKGNGFDSSYL